MPLDLHKPNVVGVASSLRDCQNSSTFLEREEVDIVEIRADAKPFLSALGGLKKLSLQKSGWLWAMLELRMIRPIITVRDPKEGGFASRLSVVARKRIFRTLLPYASLIDIEIRNLEKFKDIIVQAKRRKVSVIGSFHDFKGSPSRKQVECLLLQARKYSCSIVKLAVTTSSPEDLGHLIEFFSVAETIGVKMSLMGMGRYGKVSRLLCAKLGSVLNYGYLGEAQVEGQWYAPLLKQRIAELF